MKVVYLITEGSYSDYHVCAVCTTREKAEALIPKLKALGELDDPPEIEEYPLDEEPRKAKAWQCNVDVDSGEIAEEWEFNQVLWGDQELADESRYGDYGSGCKKIRKVFGRTARGAAVARKIAFDKRTKVLAEQEGIA